MTQGTSAQNVPKTAVLKPWWIGGDKLPILSCDVQPANAILVTGGQGSDSTGRILLWQLADILDENERQARPSPIVCNEQHLGCVNCVRWSHSGSTLASAGDDKLILLWQYNARSDPLKLVHTLHRHEGDVIDLSWSSDDSLLASASVDNRVIVWTVNNTSPRVLTILGDHQGLVKGVAFDPAGKYLVSHADDMNLRIWNVDTWNLEKSIVEPFSKSAPTTHMLRPDWAPDGSLLVAAHAVNGDGPTSPIFCRNTFESQRDLVGHSKAVTCVRFNRNVYKTGDLLYMIVALGSRDRSFSVWSTSLSRPFLVLSDVFDESVTDLTWTSDGTTLIAASMDGSLAVVKFPASILGSPLGGHPLETMLSRFSDKNSSSNVGVGGSNVDQVDNVAEMDRITAVADRHSISTISFEPSSEEIGAIIDMAELPHMLFRPSKVQNVENVDTVDGIDRPWKKFTDQFARLAESDKSHTHHASNSHRMPIDTNSGTPDKEKNKDLCLTLSTDDVQHQMTEFHTYSNRVEVRLCVRENEGNNNGLPYIICFVAGNEKWRTAFDGRVERQLIISQPPFFAVCIQAGDSIHFIDIVDGKLLCPPILAPGDGIRSISGHSTDKSIVVLAVVSCSYRLWLYKLSSVKGDTSIFLWTALVADVDASFLRSTYITRVVMTSSDEPAVVTASRRTLVYSSRARGWLVLNSVRGHLVQHSSFISQSSGNAFTSDRKQDVPTRSIADITYAQFQIASARYLQSDVDLRYWTLVLVRSLSKTNDTERLRKVISELQSTDKALYAEALGVVARYPAVARICAELT